MSLIQDAIRWMDEAPTTEQLQGRQVAAASHDGGKRHGCGTSCRLKGGSVYLGGPSLLRP